jgi:hypothetical protein
MKYIRTPDGRILEWEKLNELAKLSIDTCEEEVKEADTIEELCDIYVSVYEESLDNELFWACKYTPMEVKNFYTGYIPKEVYGAIWTDKGLIYVAKMNEKGELELL